jgi:transposase
MESGTHSAWQSELLKQRGFQVVVGNARKLAAIWMSKNKSDREDAEMLARLAHNDINLFAPIQHIPTPLRIDLAVVKTRDAVSQCRTKLINTVRGLLRSFGISTKDITADSFTPEVSKMVPKELRPAMDGILKEIRSLQLSIKTYDKLEKKLNKKYPATAVVGQPSGAGELTSMAYVLMVVDPRRFGNGDRVTRFFGLTPKRDQSGEVDKQLGITKEGNSLMRRLLLQAANHIMGRGPDCDLRRFGERIAARGARSPNARRKWQWLENWQS